MQTQNNLKSILYKACPRCGGDLMLDDSGDAYEYACLQCGRAQPVATMLQASRQLPQPRIRIAA
jgi:ribosomal protein S27AE